MEVDLQRWFSKKCHIPFFITNYSPQVKYYYSYSYLFCSVFSEICSVINLPVIIMIYQQLLSWRTINTAWDTHPQGCTEQCTMINTEPWYLAPGSFLHGDGTNPNSPHTLHITSASRKVCMSRVSQSVPSTSGYYKLGLFPETEANLTIPFLGLLTEISAVSIVFFDYYLI